MMQDIDSGRQTYRGAADRQTDIHRAGQMETERHTQSRSDTDRQMGTHRAGQIEAERETERHTQSRTVRGRQTDGHT